MKNLWLPRTALLLAVSLTCGMAQAIDASVAAAGKKYQQECAACHLAYPAGLLPKASWQRLTAHLDKHFGTDASLDEESTKQINTWLQANGGTIRRAANEEPPQERITKAQWYIREHHRISADVWKRASIGSASNCSACHANAAKGDFDEDAVRIPK